MSLLSQAYEHVGTQRHKAAFHTVMQAVNRATIGRPNLGLLFMLVSTSIDKLAAVRCPAGYMPTWTATGFTLPKSSLMEQPDRICLHMLTQTGCRAGQHHEGVGYAAIRAPEPLHEGVHGAPAQLRAQLPALRLVPRRHQGEHSHDPMHPGHTQLPFSACAKRWPSIALVGGTLCCNHASCMSSHLCSSLQRPA